MRSLLHPAANTNVQTLASWTVALIFISAILVFVAAVAMPDAYSWRAHSISESAAQGLQRAWIARLAFICFGSAVLVLSLAMRRTWPAATYWMHLAFAACMIGTAAFSHKPWIAGIPYDEFEDFLHSVTATGMGFAFCLGVAAMLFRRKRVLRMNRTLDVLALIAGTGMPMLFALYPGNGGLIQRVMFVVAYAWYGAEALALRGKQTHSR